VHGAPQEPLKRHDRVRVRGAAEILATLDEDGTFEGVPFMPEMLQYVGRQFGVATRVEKICDTIHGARSRRMRDAVYLQDLRCDGSGHGGCQAACRIYWKEQWLARAGGEDVAAPPADDEAAVAELARVAQANSTRSQTPAAENGELFSCQATQALVATEPLNDFDLTQYAREVRSRNVGVRRLAKVGARAAGTMVGRRLRLGKPIPLKARVAIKRRPGRSVPEPLGLSVGDWVQVRSGEEIGRTLDEWGKNRGLWFDREMTAYCGGTYRVKARIERIIDERSGRMIEIKSDCFVLDGVVCSGDRSPSRWLCAREIPQYWREAWLRRVDPPPWAALKTAEQPGCGAPPPERRPTGAA
jgi:hypothetical protein